MGAGFHIICNDTGNFLFLELGDEVNHQIPGVVSILTTMMMPSTNWARALPSEVIWGGGESMMTKRSLYRVLTSCNSAAIRLEDRSSAGLWGGAPPGRIEEAVVNTNPAAIPELDGRCSNNRSGPFCLPARKYGGWSAAACPHRSAERDGRRSGRWWRPGWRTRRICLPPAGRW